MVTHVDGVPITSSEGARLFFEAEPGQRLVLTYEREGVADEAELVAEERPGRHVRRTLARLRGRRDHGERLRFAGSLGDVDLEVRGLDTVQVSVDEAEDTITIRTLDATVRLTRQPGPG